MVVGEVIGVYIKNKFIKNNRVDSVSMKYIARMGYSEYTTISSKFNLKRWKFKLKINLIWLIFYNLLDSD